MAGLKSPPTVEQAKPRVVIVGPGRRMMGGVSTFVEMLLASHVLRERHDLIHLDTTRALRDIGLEDRFSLANLTYFFQQMFKFVEIAVKQKPRIAHFQVTSGLSFWKAGFFIILARFFGIKTIAHVHGGLFDQFYNNSQPLIKKMIGWQFRHSDYVITLSQKWKDFLLTEVDPQIKTGVVSNTVDTLFAEAMRNPPAAVENKEKIILFLGSLGKRKGVFDIIKAIPLVLEKHPEALFVFAGEEESRGEKSQIDQAVEEYGLSGKLRFVGRVSGDAKVELYQRSLFYLLPSYGENLPYSLLEAMAVGLPVITTPVGAIPEIISDGVNGFLIQPGDYQSLAECVICLLDDRDLRQKMSEANIEIISKDFLPEVAMKRIDDIYRRLEENHTESDDGVS